MKKHKLTTLMAAALLYFSALSILMVSAMAFINPQDVMDLVNVQLTNNDAYSSIRGVYGGVGLAIIAVIIYCAINDRRRGMLFLSILWGSYALSRMITAAKEGPLGAFGTQWLAIEFSLFAASLTLFAFIQYQAKTMRRQQASHQ